MASRMLLGFVSLAMCASFARATTIKTDVPNEILPAEQASYHSSQPGIQVQSGSVSYLLPDTKYGGYVNTIQDLVVKEGFLEKVKSTIPKVVKYVVKSLTKIAVVALSVAAVGASVVIVVSLVGFVLCKFTGLCLLPPITFAEGVAAYNNDLEEAVRAYMAPDKLTALTNFVVSSIEKYARKSRKH